MPQSARETDANGFLIVRGCPISTFGVFEYSAGQIGLEGDPNRIVKVFRPEYAVNDPLAIESFRDIPLVDDHTMLSGFEDDSINMDPDEKGVSGILTNNVYYEKPWMRGDIKVFSRGMKDKVLAQIKDDLSLGFGCKYKLEPGVWNDQEYEVVQDHIRGNHLALVKEGRIPGARVLDGLCFDHLNFDKISHKGIEMKKPVPYNKAIFLKKKTSELARMAKDAKDSGLKDGEQALDAENPAAQILAILPQLTQALTAFFGQEETEPAHEDLDPGTDPGTDPSLSEEDNSTDLPASPAQPEESATGEEPLANPPEMTEEGGEQSGNPDLASLISQVEAILAQIKGGGATDEECPMPMPAKAGKDEENLSEENTDAIEGLQEKSDKGAMMKTEDHKVTMDEAFSRFRQDESKKIKIYNRVSRAVGAFDHSAMDSKQVAVYGIKKLNIQCPKGQESIALDAYFNAMEAAAKQQKAMQSKQQQERATMDSSVWDTQSGIPELNSYLNGGK